VDGVLWEEIGYEGGFALLRLGIIESFANWGIGA
jgi:hypothetical protein